LKHREKKGGQDAALHFRSRSVLISTRQFADCDGLDRQHVCLLANGEDIEKRSQSVIVRALSPMRRMPCEGVRRFF